VKKGFLPVLAVVASLGVAGLIGGSALATKTTSTNGVIECDSNKTITFNFTDKSEFDKHVMTDMAEILSGWETNGCKGASEVVINAPNAGWVLGDIEGKIAAFRTALPVGTSLIALEKIEVNTGDVDNDGVLAIAKIAEAAVKAQGGLNIPSAVKVGINAESVDLSGVGTIPADILPYLGNTSFVVSGAVVIPDGEDPNTYLAGLTVKADMIKAGTKEYVNDGSRWVVDEEKGGGGDSEGEGEEEGDKTPDTGFVGGDEGAAASVLTSVAAATAVAGAAVAARKYLRKN
jgi:hypothetical protein